jgi:hypothetical protein
MKISIQSRENKANHWNQGRVSKTKMTTYRKIPGFTLSHVTRFAKNTFPVSLFKFFSSFFFNIKSCLRRNLWRRDSDQFRWNFFSSLAINWSVGYARTANARKLSGNGRFTTLCRGRRSCDPCWASGVTQRHPAAPLFVPGRVDAFIFKHAALK